MTSRQRVAAFRIATVANVLWWLLEITQIGRTLPTWSIIGPVLGMAVWIAAAIKFRRERS